MARGPILPKTHPTPDPKGRCGTYAGVRAHQKRGEDQCEACKVARREYHTQKQRERRTDLDKRAHDNEVGRDKSLARYHQYRALDPERYRAYERASYKAQRSRPGSPRRVRELARRNRERYGGKVPGVPTSGTLQDRLDYYGGKCWMCGADTYDVGLHWDHVKPLSKGGADALCNLRPSCPTCNLSKGGTWPYERLTA